MRKLELKHYGTKETVRNGSPLRTGVSHSSSAAGSAWAYNVMAKVVHGSKCQRGKL